MPTRRIPNTTPAVLRALKAARDEYKRTSNPTDFAISAEQWAQLDDSNPDSFLNKFIKENDDVDSAWAAQTPITEKLAASAAKLTMFVSHFHQVFDMGVARGTFSAGARSYYERDVHANSIPDLSTYDAVAEAAENIVKGEAARAKAEGTPATYDSGLKMDSGVKFDSYVGYTEMALPSADEVEAALTEFTGLRDQSDAAQVNTDKQQEDVQSLYAQAQALAVDIYDTVEFFYRKDPDASSRRAKCARWGVVYLYDQNEPQPAPPPAPAPQAAAGSK